ncbi:unnamed protein product, partial [Brenthis ino]
MRIETVKELECPVLFTAENLDSRFRLRRPVSLRLANGAGDIIVLKCTRRHKCTLYSYYSHIPVGRPLDTTGESQGAGPTALRALRGTGVKHRQLPNFGLLLRLTIQKESVTKLGPTWDSNPGPPGVQPYMLATTPPRQLNMM